MADRSSIIERTTEVRYTWPQIRRGPETVPDRQLLFHVGTHKTGTTAIQAYMSQCRAELAAQGILYPSLRPGLWKEKEAHHKVVQAVARHSIIDRVRLRRYRRWLDEAQAWARLTVLSAEPVYRHVIGDVAPGDLSAWFTAHRNYLERLAAWLTGFDVRPVVYFRPPEVLAISMYKEHVVRRLLRGGERHLASFISMTAHYYEYSRHIAALRDAFGDVVVRDYVAAGRVGLQADFAALIGATGLPPPAHAAVRTSPGNRATLWLAGQPEGLSRRDHVRRVLFALRVAYDGPFAEAGPTTLWPDRATFERFVDQHRAAWDLPFLSSPVWPDVAPTSWTPDDARAADEAFRDWETRNLGLLRKREARGLAFYEPDPA